MPRFRSELAAFRGGVSAASGYDISTSENFLRIGQSQAGGGGNVNGAVGAPQRRIEPFAISLHAAFVFLPRADIRNTRGIVQRIHKAESARKVLHNRQLANFGHPGHANRTQQAAVIVQVGLHDIGRRLDHLPVGRIYRKIVVAIGLGLFF